MNTKGQIIITDLLLYIIILTIILSLIIFTMATLNDNQVTKLNNKQLNNLLEDNFNLLVKTSGTPNNWEHLDSNNVKTIGLKSNNNHLISYKKLLKLKNNAYLLDSYFPSGVSYELTVYPKDNSGNNIYIAGTSFSNKKQIISKSEVVLFDYGYKITTFNKDNKNDYCYYNHNNTWTCKPFTTSNSLLNEGEYYIITNSNTEYILSNTYSENITETSNGITKINNKIKQLLKNNNETIYLHINNGKNGTYLVYDNNNMEEHLNNVIKQELYVIKLKIAT